MACQPPSSVACRFALQQPEISPSPPSDGPFLLQPLLVTAGRLRSSSLASSDPWFGNLVIILFLVAQVLDGALTYLGIAFGISEGNPLVAYAFRHAGVGPGLTLAKFVAVGCSMALHLLGLHRVLALLTLMYLSLAILPWTYLLYFAH
jgi:hypothetical protein